MNGQEAEQIMLMIAAAFPHTNISGETVAIYSKALEDIDGPVVRRACIDLLKTAKFPPTIAEIREQAYAIRRRQPAKRALPDSALRGKAAQLAAAKARAGIRDIGNGGSGARDSEFGRIAPSGRWVARWQTSDKDYPHVWGAEQPSDA